jgi:hypothetical protein
MSVRIRGYGPSYRLVELLPGALRRPAPFGLLSVLAGFNLLGVNKLARSLLIVPWFALGADWHSGAMSGGFT